MNFKFLLILTGLMLCFTTTVSANGDEGKQEILLCSDPVIINKGGACVENETLRAIALEVTSDKKYSAEEISEMKGKAVKLSMYDGGIIIQLFPEDAPNTVNNFLKLVESGYYDGVVFHRTIHSFMIQTGDPNTKDPLIPKEKWGQGGPGYNIKEEFNALQHDRGIVSMARSSDPDSAGSQFFIMHKDTPSLDAEYTAFGRIVPLGNGYRQLDLVAGIPSSESDRPDPEYIHRATIIKAEIIDNFSPPPIVAPDRNDSIITSLKVHGGFQEHYLNYVHNIKFEIPYRWTLEDRSEDSLNLLLEPGLLEHNVQVQIDRSGVTPQVMIFSMPRDPTWLAEGEVDVDFLTIKNAGKPTILENYIFEDNSGRKNHIIITKQTAETETESVDYQTMQIRFNNKETDYVVMYVHAADFFRYEVNSFFHIVKTFEVMVDGELEQLRLYKHPIFKQILNEARSEPEPEALPPARIGGCLIATAAFGSEMAPQVQLLREIRDNTVLQTQSGTSFMSGFNHFYYSFSPIIADYERESPVFKEAVKLTLTPLLASLTLLQYTDIDSEHEMLGYGIGLIFLNIGMYFIAPAILITKIRSFYKLQ